ncbi:AI-2E family transporter [Phreatobacter sp.]|uniref:AI-2E family transporter n=1 Tax=Phreatobacter sp. TaxID=1966341 RepID=UPI0025FDB3AC|nr:AI-2E family transporter [Phreatobacter sp.]
MRKIDDMGFAALLMVVSLLFAWILWPFFGAILWAVVTAIVFAPVNQRVTRAMPDKPSLAALVTLLAILHIVILPCLAIGASLVAQGAETYAAIQDGRIDVAALIGRVIASLPAWVTDFAARYDIYNADDVQKQIAAWATASSESIASRAVSIGQGTAGFVISLGVMLYLLFFLMRDGGRLIRRIANGLPLQPHRRRALLDKFTLVVRATVKGGILIALLQGALGGVIFWLLGLPSPLLWAALMAFLSLVPAVGAGLVWGPVAIYLLATGSLWQGVVLIGFGVMVIGLADNVLRPRLVGKDVKLPDYLILISTLGGIEIFGLNGFVVGPLIAAMFVTVWQMLAETLPDDEEGETPDSSGPD